MTIVRPAPLPQVHPDAHEPKRSPNLAQSGLRRSLGSALLGVALGAAWMAAAGTPETTPPPSVSGIYPHLAMFNDESECGTGAVVPWAGRLWVITYGPHLPYGSSDRLYEISPDLQQVVRPESVGGTHANRMIHRESQQLIIGPYVIDAQRRVRVIPPRRMPGRLTGNARHLVDPSNRVYFATMEEGLYEVDVRSLEVVGLIRDGNRPTAGQTDELRPAPLSSQLPGYHGKGLYSGQGRLIYANNGEEGRAALVDPTIESGALAEWNKPGEDWRLIRRNQFTDVTGPGGVSGNPHPETDPVWSVGWDARSVLLLCLDGGQWHVYRLPKGSHSYDGAHGWNTEWPRIRDVGEADLLMTMHGTFWRFPKRFAAVHSAGIVPRSSYLKVIGDFCRWEDRLVFGCDDSARSEFLNQRRAKGKIAGPGRSQSNLWFVPPARLDHLGPVLGRGAVWLDDPVRAGQPSDPFLFAGYPQRTLHLSHATSETVNFLLEVDAVGDGRWKPLRSLTVPPQGYQWITFSDWERGAWIRLVPDRDATGVTAMFHNATVDRRGAASSALFAGLAPADDVRVTGGLLHARGGELRTLRFLARNPGGDLGCYDLDANLKLRRTNDLSGAEWMRTNLAIPPGVLTLDAASVLYVDERGRWRLPKGDAAFDRRGPWGGERICREVCTERDLFNAAGTFFELPAENAGGMAKIRPVATHNRRIFDYASFRGLLVLSGLSDQAKGQHVVESDDGRCRLWVGAVDDLWQLGKPRGVGGPWKDSVVRAQVPSDPYLMTGYDRKRLALAHASSETVRIRVEVDVTGNGVWVNYREFEVPTDRTVRHRFPAGFSAYWVRVVADRDTTGTALFRYD